MKKIETLFVGASLLIVAGVAGGVVWHQATKRGGANHEIVRPESKFGSFLAAQHAIYINDFDSAARFSENLADTDIAVVQNTKILSEFLSGRLPADAALLEKEKTAPSRFIYDAYLVHNEKWEDFYKRHKSDDGALTAPLRIWATVAAGRPDEAIKFVNSLPTAEAWRNFVRGQIYAEQGDIDKAAEQFAAVSPDFMNLNDYLYIMSFYSANGRTDAAKALRANFTSRPGGMFMLDYETVPAWSRFSGVKNALSFSLVQNVSHTQIMMYSDLAILMLRMAQIVAPNMGADTDSINYYLGQYFYTNSGNYERYFSRIDSDSPFFPFASLRNAQKADDVSAMRRVAREHPLFVPAVNDVVARYVKNGRKREALAVVNAALKDNRIDDAGHAFFLKSRARIHYVFGDYDAAAADLHAAADVLVMDPEILSLQARIWAEQGREIETAYEYAMGLVRNAPSDIQAWDTLGRVVTVREGPDVALDLVARVGEVASTCSALFELLGDLYGATGDKNKAKDAYMRAIELADDGLSVVPDIKRKLRNLK